MHNLYIYSTYYKWVYCINIVFLIYSIYIETQDTRTYWWDNCDKAFLIFHQGAACLTGRRPWCWAGDHGGVAGRSGDLARDDGAPTNVVFFFWGGRGLGRRIAWSGERIVGQAWIGCNLCLLIFFFWSLVTAVISYKMDWCCRNVCQNFEFLPTKAMCAQCVSMELPGVWRHLYMTFFGNVRGYVEFFSIQFVWKRSSIIQCCFSESNQI